ncbi:S-methyl-5-thioribose-1-phosphate isomerase [Synechocystis sp. FACHB-383]|uniref:S-methyl-5-thioribose-1-phosphate isomerase n=1 Tax=Synechocystis sp. FACHB-383 TaxID=2692864 RepID=UPI0016833D05|nr:S-methyl-5-thioribose-1-phosphate isomerase [Synechocystis sp. FACHB-383]MBD2652723.1 S-methyl-5-thioribose-1-phosphate isomerase [Synechocystis sp. FACHB-383]
MTQSTNFVDVYPVQWRDDQVILIDQTRLPLEYKEVAIADYEAMGHAIKSMVVRGAPAIGVAAAYGMYLGARRIQTTELREFVAQLEFVADQLRQTRPTAVNLFWAIDQMLNVAYHSGENVEQVKANLLSQAQQIQLDDLRTCQAIGAAGLEALPREPQQLTILTHCNAGALATAGYGTAIGVIRAAWSAGRLARVYADETRPRLQGAKLTVWECVQAGIPVTLITDNMAAHCMQQQRIDAVVVGADRIARNGDTANKIGTYGLAVLAKMHAIPFFVAAPLSTVDFALDDGSQIPIEERDPVEIYQPGSTRITPEGAEFYNPAFDVTPASLITAIITEQGAIAPGQLADLEA